MQQLEGVGTPVRKKSFVECNLAQSLAFMTVYCRQKATEAKLFTPQTLQRMQSETTFLYFDDDDDDDDNKIAIKAMTEQGQ